jgi:alpha-amylase
LSGGFFEPLLASIPVPDARGQVRRMNDYLMHRFGRRPTGFWLTERVWDPDLPRTLAGTEMRYTVVDDTHFYYAGLKPEEIYGRYVTEKDGHTMSLLATPMRMRYLIPFRQVEEVMGHLRWLEETGRTVVVYGDDGEKFGLWPGTHEWVIQKGWLEKFFTALADSADWLQTILPEDFLESSKSLGRLYLPQASYEEMTEWALPPEQGKALEDIIRSLKDEGRWETWRSFVRGGIWDNFLVKYDEANRMHKKMLFLSGKVSQNGKLRDFVWRG